MAFSYWDGQKMVIWPKSDPPPPPKKKRRKGKRKRERKQSREGDPILFMGSWKVFSRTVKALEGATPHLTGIQVCPLTIDLLTIALHRSCWKMQFSCSSSWNMSRAGLKIEVASTRDHCCHCSYRHRESCNVRWRSVNLPAVLGPLDICGLARLAGKILFCDHFQLKSPFLF